MSHYRDEGGVPYGTSVPLTCDERVAIVGRNGGMQNLVPFAGRTDMEPDDGGPPHLLTDWGLKGAVAPLFHDDVRQGQSCSHAEFILSGSADE